MLLIKKRIITIPIFIATICIIFSNCNLSDSKSDESGEFAIFLLADSTISAVHAVTQLIDTLILEDQPLIAIEDVEQYKWSDHTLTLNTENDRLKAMESSTGKSLGIPFVITVGEERIYLGGFWYWYSSYMPSFPYTSVSSKGLYIEKGVSDGTKDVRNDDRIYQSLKAAGVLIE